MDLQVKRVSVDSDHAGYTSQGNIINMSIFAVTEIKTIWYYTDMNAAAHSLTLLSQTQGLHHFILHQQKNTITWQDVLFSVCLFKYTEVFNSRYLGPILFP